MFDHLGANRKIQVTHNHRFVLSVLILASVTLSLSFSFLLIPKHEAPPADGPVRITLDDGFVQARGLVGDQNNIVLASYVIEAPIGSKLHKISFLADGLYSPDNFGTFKLYLDNAQLGNDVLIDQNGKINFFFEEVTLNNGRHDLTLRSDWEVINEAETFSIILEEHEDFQISTATGIKRPSNIFPVKTALTSFVSEGEVFVFTSAEPPRVVQVGIDQTPYVDFNFSIGSKYEPVDITEVDFSLVGDGFKMVKAELYNGSKLIKSWTEQEELKGVIKPGDLVVSPSLAKEVKLRVYASALDSRIALELFVNDLQARGVNSNGVFNSNNSLSKVGYISKDRLLTKLINQPEAKSVSFELELASGLDLALNSIPFELATEIEIENWQVYLNGKLQSTNFSKEGNILTLDFNSPVIIKSGDNLEVVPVKASNQPKGSVALRLLDQDIVWQQVSESNRWFAWAPSSIKVLGIEYLEI